MIFFFFIYEDNCVSFRFLNLQQNLDYGRFEIQENCFTQVDEYGDLVFILFDLIVKESLVLEIKKFYLRFCFLYDFEIFCKIRYNRK